MASRVSLGKGPQRGGIAPLISQCSFDGTGKGVLPKSRTAAVSVLRPAAAAQNRRYYSNSRMSRSNPHSLFRVSGFGQQALDSTPAQPSLLVVISRSPFGSRTFVRFANRPGDVILRTFVPIGLNT